MTTYGLSYKEIQHAIANAVPVKPVKVELGGGYYYRCHWLKCNEPLKRWNDFCPACGQHIDWSDEE